MPLGTAPHAMKLSGIGYRYIGYCTIGSLPGFGLTIEFSIGRIDEISMDLDQRCL